MTHLLRTFLVLFLIFPFLAGVSLSAGVEEQVTYKLAMLHARNEDPKSVLLKKKVEPSTAVLSEFAWILQTMQNRCADSEDSIANTIVETWYITKNKGAQLSLLEIGRILSQISQNTNLFGRDKIPSRMISKYWLAKHFLPAVQK